MKNLSKYTYLICILSILGSALYFPRWNQRGPEATISWDTAGYYYYLPAIFIYKDIKQVAFKDKITEKYKPSGSFYQAFFHEPSGNYVMKYSIGQAVMMTPFFLAGHAYASVSDSYPADGFSKPYQRAIHWGSLLIAFIGLWFCRKNLLEYFDDTATAFTLLFLTIGTNYLNYTAFDGAMTHNWLFTVYALLIWVSIQWHKKPTWGLSAAVGVLVGLAALTRPTDIIALIIPVFWGMKLTFTDIKHRFSFLAKYWNHLAVAVVITAAIGSIQIIYWLYVTGLPVVYSYQDQYFEWHIPHLKDVLISYRSGWLTYSPIMVFAIIGLLNLAWQKMEIFFAILFFSLLNYYIVSSWSVWWYGGSFGMRALIQSYPIWAFPLAAFITWMLNKTWRNWVFLPIMFFFCAMNIFFTRGPIDAEYMNKTYYWYSLFNFNTTDRDRLLLDTDEGFFEERKNVEVVFTTNVQEEALDSTKIYWRNTEKTNAALFTNADMRNSPVLKIAKSDIKNGTWLRAGAKFKMPDKEWFYWTMPQFTIRFVKSDGTNIKERFIRCPRALEQGEWNTLWIDSAIPQEEFSHLELLIQQPYGTKMLLGDDFFIETYTSLTTE